MIISKKLWNHSLCASIIVRSGITAEDWRKEPLLHATEVSYVAVNVAGMKLLGCSMPFSMPFNLQTIQLMYSVRHLRSFVNRISSWGQQKLYIRSLSALSSDWGDKNENPFLPIIKCLPASYEFHQINWKTTPCLIARSNGLVLRAFWSAMLSAFSGS